MLFNLKSTAFKKKNTRKIQKFENIGIGYDEYEDFLRLLEETRNVQRVMILDLE